MNSNTVTAITPQGEFISNYNKSLYTLDDSFSSYATGGPTQHIVNNKKYCRKLHFDLTILSILPMIVSARIATEATSTIYIWVLKIASTAQTSLTFGGRTCLLYDSHAHAYKIFYKLHSYSWFMRTSPSPRL